MDDQELPSGVFFDPRSWTIRQIRDAVVKGTLDYKIEYQRRRIWQPADKSLLLDSIIRGAPIGQLSLFEPADQPGRFEVVDGKQRISSLIEYVSSRFRPDISHVQEYADEEEGAALPTPDRRFDEVWRKPFMQLEMVVQDAILDYPIPAVLLTGSRDAAVASFVRMNRQGYHLEPQELRNALFWKSDIRSTIVSYAKAMYERNFGPFLALGVIGRRKMERMHDAQLLSELVLLVSVGPTNRRDHIDTLYSAFFNPGPSSWTGNPASLVEGIGDANKTVEGVVELLLRIERSVGGRIQHLGFPREPENDFYSAFGSLWAFEREMERPLTTDEIRNCFVVWGDRRAEVSRYLARRRSGERSADSEYDDWTVSYGSTFLGSQVNSARFRCRRLTLLHEAARSLIDA